MGNGWVEWTAVMEGFGQDCSLWGAWLVHDSLWLNLSFAEAFAFVQGFFALHQWSDSSASYCSMLEKCPRALFYAHACDPNKPHSVIFYCRTPPNPWLTNAAADHPLHIHLTSSMSDSYLPDLKHSHLSLMKHKFQKKKSRASGRNRSSFKGFWKRRFDISDQRGYRC